jgi:hypothetical protein
MSFTTPTVDVYLPGTTLGIGNVNAGTINIGKTTTQINVGGPTTFTNSVAAPSCTMASLTTGNLIISPYSENVRFSNLSATNATVTNMSATNASFQRFNSSNILIGPYPQNGTFDTINVTNPTITNLNSTNVNSTNINALNASMTTINVSGFLISPLTANPTFTSINTPNIDVNANGTLTLGNQNATAVYIGSSGTRNVINNIGTGSGTGTIYIGNNTNSIALAGQTTLSKPLILGTLPTGYEHLGFKSSIPGVSFSSSIASGSTGYCYSPPNGTTGNFLYAGVYLMSCYAFAYFTGTVTACTITMDIAIISSTATPSGTGIANGLFNTRIGPQINTPTASTIPYFPTYTVTVTSNNYYYLSCGVSSVSITGGGTVSTGCQLLSMVRIA